SVRDPYLERIPEVDCNADILSALISSKRVTDAEFVGIALRQAAGQARIAPILVAGRVERVGEVSLNGARRREGEQLMLVKIEGARAVDDQRVGVVGEPAGGAGAGGGEVER